MPARIISPEGFPLTDEILAGSRLDCTTLEHILGMIAQRFGEGRRLWVSDCGIVSEDGLEPLRQRGAPCLVGATTLQLKTREQPFLDGDWPKVSEAVPAHSFPKPTESSVCRSTGWVRKNAQCPGEPALGWLAVKQDWVGGSALKHTGGNTMNFANARVTSQRDFATLVCVNQGGDLAFEASDGAVSALPQGLGSLAR